MITIQFFYHFLNLSIINKEVEQDQMENDARSYIIVAKNNASYKVYLKDVRARCHVIKKQTPRLPGYHEQNNNN